MPLKDNICTSTVSLCSPITCAIKLLPSAIYRVNEEALVAETAVWSIPFLINMYNALKGSQLFFIFYSLCHQY